MKPERRKPGKETERKPVQFKRFERLARSLLKPAEPKKKAK